jgi:molecular chaperone DnaK
MTDKPAVIFGIDLGTTYSCISYMDEHGKTVIVPNKEHHLTTPSVVMFEGGSIIVGNEAKNSALLNPDAVVEMVKRHMGETHWRFPHEDKEYSPEEISSYILRKLALDTEMALGFPVKDVVITCPAYFGIAQREATARAGEIAGLKVHEVINEPTAAAITYGLQDEQEQVVLVYDLGGGTFDVTVISIKAGSITVVATGGDHNLGGRNWDEAIVLYLAQQWQEQTGMHEDPTESSETLQDLWHKAERAKWALTVRQQTKVVVVHAGQQVKVPLTRAKFEELTHGLLDRTLLFTKLVMREAEARGYHSFDKQLLVGGSTKMPQVGERLDQEFHIPLLLFEPEEAVARGAAIYGQKLRLDQRIQIKIAQLTGSPTEEIEIEKHPTLLPRAQESVAKDFGMDVEEVAHMVNTSITNVTSHSFGIIVTVDHQKPTHREVVENLLLVNDPLPAFRVHKYGTLEPHQAFVELQIIENTQQTRVVELTDENQFEEIGTVTVPLPPGLPAHSPVEVTFEIDRQGRLHVVGRQSQSRSVVEAAFETRGGITPAELHAAKSRASKLTII